MVESAHNTRVRSDRIDRERDELGGNRKGTRAWHPQVLCAPPGRPPEARTRGHYQATGRIDQIHGRAQASQRTSLSPGESCIGGSTARVVAVVVGFSNIASKAATWTQKSNSAEFLVSACLPLTPPAGSGPNLQGLIIPYSCLRFAEIERASSPHDCCR